MHAEKRSASMHAGENCMHAGKESLRMQSVGENSNSNGGYQILSCVHLVNIFIALKGGAVTK